MMRFLETVWLGFFLTGLLLLGVFGTWTETAPFWYGAGLIAVSGIGALLPRQGLPSVRISWTAILLMAGFACYFGWRGFTSEVRWLARQDLVFGGTALVTYGLIAVRFTGTRARLAILAVLGLLIAGNTAVGLYQYFGDQRWTVFQWFGLKRAGELTAGGFFENSNHMANFMLLAGMPLLGIAVLGRGLNRGIRLLAGLGFLWAGTGVAFTTSRGGAAGFLAGIMVFTVITVILWRGERKSTAGKSSGKGWWLIGLMIAFLGLTAGAGIQLKRTFGSTATITTLGVRSVMWDAALEQWQLAPFLGTGARSYEYMERGFRTPETKWILNASEIDAVFAHNDYLQCLADYGMIGLGLALLVAAYHVWNAMLLLVKAASHGAGLPGEGMATGLAAGAVAGMAGLMTHALTEFNLHVGINAVITGLLLGLMATPGFKRTSLPAAPKEAAASASKTKAGPGICGRHLATAVVLAAVSLILLATGWRLAPADFACRKGKKELTTAVTLSELIAASGTFQKATALDPENAQAWFMRGLVSLQIASLTNEKYATPFYEASLTQFEQALTKYPQLPYAAAQAGSVAGYLGRIEKAEAHFISALKWGVSVRTVNELYGDFLMKHRKDYAKSVLHFIVALKVTVDPEAIANLQRKINLCLKRLQPQGITPPASAFLPPPP